MLLFRLGVPAIVVAAGLATWGARKLYLVNVERHTLPFPLDAGPAVGRLIYAPPVSQLPPPPPGGPMPHDWQVAGEAVDVPPDLAAELRQVLASPEAYTGQDSQCFEPGMAISFGGSGPSRVDVLICLLCNRAMFYRNDQHVGRCLSGEGNRRLTSIYDRLFGQPPQH